MSILDPTPSPHHDGYDSAQPCGCDPFAGRECERHTRDRLEARITDLETEVQEQAEFITRLLRYTNVPVA